MPAESKIQPVQSQVKEVSPVTTTIKEEQKKEVTPVVLEKSVQPENLVLTPEGPTTAPVQKENTESHVKVNEVKPALEKPSIPLASSARLLSKNEKPHESVEVHAPKAEKIAFASKSESLAAKSHETNSMGKKDFFSKEPEKPISHESEISLAKKLIEPLPSASKNSGESDSPFQSIKAKFKEPILDIMSQPLFTSNDNESRDAGKLIGGIGDPLVMRFSVKAKVRKNIGKK